MMYRLHLYKVKGGTFNRFKWLLSYNSYNLARSEADYSSPSAALRAFNRLSKVLNPGPNGKTLDVIYG